MPTAYIIPGFHETKKNPAYQTIGRAFQQYQIKTKILTPTWKRHTMSEYVSEVHRQLPKDSRNDYILGFSFGAYISFLIASHQQFAHQFLCSISPYFFETKKGIKKSWRSYLGTRRMMEFDRYRMNDIARSIDTPTSLFVGGTEGDLMINVTKKIGQSIPNTKSVTIIHGIGHKIQDEKYLHIVETNIQTILSRK